MSEEAERYIKALEDERMKPETNCHLWNPSPPCACDWCQEWVDEWDLFWIVGDTDKKIICESCLEDLLKERVKRVMEASETLGQFII